jgi:hypothetical protein
MTIQSPHTLSYCALCETEMVRCAVCDNNSCNGGSGEVDGKRCEESCDEAGIHQQAYWKDPSSVIFAKDLREEHKSAGEKRLTELAEAGLFRG